MVTDQATATTRHSKNAVARGRSLFNQLPERRTNELQREQVTIHTGAKLALSYAKERNWQDSVSGESSADQWLIKLDEVSNDIFLLSVQIRSVKPQKNQDVDLRKRFELKRATTPDAKCQILSSAPLCE